MDRIYIGLFVVAYTKVSLPKIDNFAAFCSIIVSFACLQTAYLLYYQSKVYEETSLSILASGYLITSLLTSAYTLIFPNLIFSFQDPNIANQAISWLWYFSHAIFPLFLIIYVLLGSKTRFLFYTTSQWIFRLSPLRAVFLITIAMTSSQLLPAVIGGG
jgi:cytochrome bd-type quinol oxidase subunit 2